MAVLFLGLILAGLIAYAGLPIKQYPNIQFPVVSVTVTQNGAAPGEIETQITRPVEDALAGISGVKNVQSTVSQGASTTSMQFEIGENLQKKTDEVRSKIAQARAILPRDIDEPIVQQLEIDEAAPILTYAVAAPGMTDDAALAGSSTIRWPARCRQPRACRRSPASAGCRARSMWSSALTGWRRGGSPPPR